MLNAPAQPNWSLTKTRFCRSVAVRRRHCRVSQPRAWSATVSRALPQRPFSRKGALSPAHAQAAPVRAFGHSGGAAGVRPRRLRRTPAPALGSRDRRNRRGTAATRRLRGGLQMAEPVPNACNAAMSRNASGVPALAESPPPWGDDLAFRVGSGVWQKQPVLRAAPPTSTIPLVPIHSEPGRRLWRTHSAGDLARRTASTLPLKDPRSRAPSRVAPSDPIHR